MRKNKVQYLLLIFLLSGCQRVDTLTDSDKTEVISQIIKNEKIKNISDNFSGIDPGDSTLYYIAYSPDDVQKYNRSSSIIDFDKLFDKDDLLEFKKQIHSFDTTLRLSHIIKNINVKIYQDSDTSRNPGFDYSLSYPLFNKKKNVAIIFVRYYGGMMVGGEYVLIYAKKDGKWVQLSQILLMMV